MQKLKVILLSFLVVSLVFVTACGGGSDNSGQQQTGNPIKIGVNIALSGPIGGYGEDTKIGLEIRREELNAEGGVLGRPIELVYYDDENDPEKTVGNALQLINQDGLRIHIGPFFAANMNAAQPIADSNQTLMWGLSGAYFPPADSYMFAGITHPTNVVKELMHQWFVKKGIKKVGLIASDELSGQESVDMVEKLKLNGKDGIEYITIRYGAKDTDTTPQLTQLKNNGVEALFIIGSIVPVSVVVKSASQLGMDIPYVFTNAPLNGAFGKLIKDYVEPGQAIFVGPPIFAYEEMSDDNPLKPIVTNLADKVKSKYNDVPEGGHGQGYDILSMLAKAIELAGSDDPTAVKEALETKVGEFYATDAVVKHTKEDHNGIGMDGAVLINLDSTDASFHIEWEPEFWK